MKTVPSPVSDALLLICEKCGKKLVGDTDANPARELQQALKERIKQTGLKGQVRAVVSSCMDVCPKGEIAVGVAYAGARNSEFLTLELREVAGAVEPLLDRALKG